jgi:hypothetical protein
MTLEGHSNSRGAGDGDLHHVKGLGVDPGGGCAGRFWHWNDGELEGRGDWQARDDG